MIERAIPDTIRKDSQGIPINVELIDSATGRPLDLSGLTTLSIEVRKPDNSISSVSAAFVTDGKDGAVTAQVPVGLFGLVGAYAAWVAASNAGESWTSTKVALTVVEN